MLGGLWKSQHRQVGGGSGPVTSASIADASASGRQVLTSTPSQGRAALGLGGAALLDAGVAGGVAPLDGSAKIPQAYLPAIAVTEFLGHVPDLAAQLALTGQLGDWCIRDDLGATFVVVAADTSQTSSWVQLSYPAAPVSSVAGRTGAVVLSVSDVYGFGSAALLDASSLQNKIGNPSGFLSRNIVSADDGATLVCSTAQVATINLGLSGFNGCIFKGVVSFGGTAQLEDLRVNSQTKICAVIRVGVDSYSIVGGV